ncbi:unnamed protein product, partial [Gongylonema pulchrum]|uniref:Polyprotein n=2 Tax=Gongylonema pulchrum TaxID=637853 RepID=A0A183EBW3_9BILA
MNADMGPGRYSGSQDIWEGHSSWVKHFLKQVLRGKKQDLIQAMCANKTKQEIMDNLERWVSSQGSNVQTRFSTLKKRIQQMKSAIQQKVEQSSMLSEDAKNVLHQIRAVTEDMTVTPEEELAQLQAITSEVNPEVFRQIKDFMDLLRKALRGKQLTSTFITMTASTDDMAIEFSTTEMPETSSVESGVAESTTGGEGEEGDGGPDPLLAQYATD